MRVSDLNQSAKDVINLNWRKGFTVPTSKLYPFQWLWDSGFVALGSSFFDLNKSITEIKTMFSGQWENGMLPHILFHSESEETYFPNFDFWESKVNPGAPQFPKSSGITQPPVFGFVLHELYKRHRENEKLTDFIKEIYPKILNFHRFFYTYRDHNKEGLVFIFHPWESGRDNSPMWDEAMNAIIVNEHDIPSYTRRDTQLMDPEERPTKDKYDRYVYLLELGKRHQYDGKGIAQESPFLIQDCMMNAILIKSNAALIELGDAFGFDTGEVREWQAQSLSVYHEKFWNDELQYFVSYDCRQESQMLCKEIGGLVSLFAESATKVQAEHLAKYLQSLHDRGFYLCPSFDVDSHLFDSKRYWRGPIWPQMNWMIMKGLEQYDYHTLAGIVKSDLIELVSQLGFHEYFEPQKSIAKTLTKGYGGDNFSWTASIILNMINH